MFGYTKQRAVAVLAAAAVAIGLGTATVSAQGRWNRGPGGRGMHGPMMGVDGIGLGRLDLTEAQRSQVQSIMEAHRAERQALAEKVRDARQALHAKVTAETLDESGIRAAHAALSQLEADQVVMRAKIRAEIHQLLTPEQRAKAAELKAQAQKRRADRVERAKQRMQQRMQQRPQARPPAGL